MGFAELNSLQSRLNILQGNLSSYERQLRDLEKRRDKIQEIIRDMKSVCNNKSSDINGYINNIINTFDSAIKGVIYFGKSKASSSKEKSIDSDGNMNSSHTYLKSELNDVNHKIDDLRSKINSTKRQIEECKGQIIREKSAIADSYRRNYNNAYNKRVSAERAYKSNPSDARLKTEYEKAKRKETEAKREYNNYKGWL